LSSPISAVLFATDIAARGLDFPAIDWVVQADCPDDVAQYIHRVGRTARFRAGGKALLLLLPSESGFISQLQQKHVPIKRTQIDPSKTVSMREAVLAAVAEDPELKFLAQKVSFS
jgi:ATP-dependent RNA helicase DDX10/DBP4